MTYITAQSLVDRFGAAELAQVADDSGQVDATLLELTITAGDRSAYTAAQISAADAALVRINQAIADAEAEIDGYIGTQYTLPLPSVPQVIVAKAADLARYALYDEQATQQVKDRHDSAITLLTALSKGVVTLGIATPPPTSDPPSSQSPGRIFTNDTLKDY